MRLGLILRFPAQTSGGLGREASRLLALAGGKTDTGNTIILSQDVQCDSARPTRCGRPRRREEFLRSRRPDRHRAGGDYDISSFPPRIPGRRAHGTKGARLLALEPGRFLAFEWSFSAAVTGRRPGRAALCGRGLRRPSPLKRPGSKLGFTRGIGPFEFRHFGFRRGVLWNQSRAWFTRPGRRARANEADLRRGNRQPERGATRGDFSATQPT